MIVLFNIAMIFFLCGIGCLLIWITIYILKGNMFFKDKPTKKHNNNEDGK
jgi:hypothetical protein